MTQKKIRMTLILIIHFFYPFEWMAKVCRTTQNKKAFCAESKKSNRFHGKWHSNSGDHCAWNTEQYQQASITITAIIFPGTCVVWAETNRLVYLCKIKVRNSEIHSITGRLVYQNLTLSDPNPDPPLQHFFKKAIDDVDVGDAAQGRGCLCVRFPSQIDKHYIGILEIS